MGGEPQDLLMEILRPIQADVAVLRNNDQEFRSQLIDIRQLLVTMQNDALRQERSMAAMQVELDRVKSRLELRDA
jgi:hypothetical protein